MQRNINFVQCSIFAKRTRCPAALFTTERPIP